MSHDETFKAFQNPPTEFGIIPFWFWNDDLQEAELIRQLHVFHDAGFGGVMPHARVGLSHRVGYLTDEFFRLMKVVVDEAARLGMKVILYDEGSYPSGSANGAVVAENPEYACRALLMRELDVVGPHDGFWRPNTGRAMMDRHVCTVVGQVDDDGSVNPETLEVLEPQDHDVIQVRVPAGPWKVMSIWDVAGGGTIRGVFEESEDGHATAPAAGDILNPDAVDCFIRLTHDRYYEVLKEHFGETVIAMFTDEPNTRGRGSRRRGARFSFTPGFVEWLEQEWGEDPRPWLPALYADYGEDTEVFRERYEAAVQKRLQEVFYKGQSDWCADHGIDLTGHPKDSNDMTSLRLFQLPGQDMVWRYVEPNKPTALEGEHSIAAKGATSGARLSNRRRILTEVCGAYGWNLTLDELKWLFDWHIVRGNNLLNPHAVFYTIRERRAWESEPDLAIHNVWWPHFTDIAVYSRRLSWLLTDGEHVCDVAILGDGNHLPWQAAKQLYQNQVDFLYLDDQAVAEAEVADGRLEVGSQRYGVVILEEVEDLHEGAQRVLDRFSDAGGTVIEFDPDTPVIWQVRHHTDADVMIQPANPDLRFIHYRKLGLDLYLFVNEGEETIRGTVDLSVTGRVELWDALSGNRVDGAVASGERGAQLDLELGRRESIVVVVDPGRAIEVSDPRPVSDEQVQEIDVTWSVADESGRKVERLDLLDWSHVQGLELFSGTLVYRAEVDVAQTEGRQLDLGNVGDIAELYVDGERVGVRMWSPYVFDLTHLDAGVHQFEVRVTNSMANEYEGAQRPSGMMGPVRIISAKTDG